MTPDEFVDEYEAGMEFNQRLWMEIIEPYINVYGADWCLQMPAFLRLQREYSRRIKVNQTL